MNWLITDFIQWVHKELTRLHDLIEGLRSDADLAPAAQTPLPATVQQVVSPAAPATVPALPPDAPSSGNPDGDRLLGAYLGTGVPGAQPSEPPSSGGSTYPSGDVLDSFSQPKVNNMVSGELFVFHFEPPAGTASFTFAVLNVVGTVASMATVTIRDGEGNIVQGPSMANTSGWNSLPITYAAGLTAEVTVDATGPLGAQLHLA